MAKRRSRVTRATKKGGPYLAAAVFCDSIVEGADKTMSVIRIVDRVNLTIPAEAPADIPSKDKPVPVTMNALISFRTGYGGGRHEIKLVIESPSGKRQDGPKQVMDFGKVPNSGANLKLAFGMLVPIGGVYWFNVLLDGKVVTRMPLDIAITRAPAEPKPVKPDTKAKSKR